ncbi:hypothetical protein M422DRAFT_29698 [Sphaerobolus stellatus SS14]|uniref:Mediator of RNA polymerase II transcription subunit 6 n=1 Tax=Sphaerobolus stellatus (strain SS14) TaxID=990650 RepID=A0A0C9VST3_SPHS4|nr:hypothetical protein M422DRAFT_29698 [Sphaerobolus stellatus SS14]
MDSSHPQDDFSSRFFIWHEWIQAHGPLTRDNVLDYFATSMFYDKQSNNQVLRMQTMHTGMPLENEAEELRRFTGIEFALVYDEAPTLFIIHKQDRLSPDEVRPLVAYFITHNRIYQAPDLYNVVSNRLLATLSSLQSSLGTLLSHKPDFTPRTGFVWPIAHAKAPTDDAEAALNKSQVAPEQPTVNDISSPAKRRQMAMPKKHENATLLFYAMRTTAAEKQQSPEPQLPIPAPSATEPPQSAAGSPETPGPSPVDRITPSEEILKGGKKKRKRGSVAPT